MKNNKDTATPKELLAELQALVADAEKMVGSAAGDASSEVVDALRDRYEAMQDKLSGAYDGAKKKVVAGAKHADESVRENPYQALAIAAGVGLLVGVLLGRRSK